MRRVLVAAAVAFACAGCGNLLDPAAAVVYGEKIPLHTVEDAVDAFVRTPEFRRLAEQGDEQALKRQFEQGYLSQLIRRAVLAPQAEEYGVTVSQEDVDEAMEEIRDQFPTEEAFDQALTEQGLTLDQLEVLVRDREIESELRDEVTDDVDPAEADLRTYYEGHLNLYSRTRAQHILVQDESLAADLAAQLQAAGAGEIDDLFAELAAEHSEDESNAGKAGDLGFFTSGQFVQEFEEAAAELDVGEVSDPVQTEFGWHVIRVTDREVETFEEARDEIEERVEESLEEEVWSDWLASIYEEAGVKVNPRYGTFDLEDQQVVEPGAEDVPGGYEPDAPAPSSPAVP